MKTLLQVTLALFFYCGALTVCAQPSAPETGTMIELKTKKVGSALVIEPAEIRLAILIWPEPSPTFKAVEFNGPVKGKISRAIPLKDGGIALATSHGGYIISKKGDVKVVGQGELCQSLAVSPTGEIAFGFSRQLPFRLVDDVRREDKQIIRTVLEIHTIGPKPRTIVLSQQRTSDSFSGEMTFNKDGSVLATVTYSVGITLIKGDVVWRDPKAHYNNLTGGMLEFNPTDGNEFLYACHLYKFKSYDGSFTKVNLAGHGKNPSSLYGSKGEIISIKKNSEGSHRLYDGDSESSFDRNSQPRWNGIGCMAVNEKYVAYANLGDVIVWSRADKKALGNPIVPSSEAKFLDKCVNALAFSPTGELIITTNNQVSEWNPETGKKIREIVQAR